MSLAQYPSPCAPPVLVKLLFVLLGRWVMRNRVFIPDLELIFFIRRNAGDSSSPLADEMQQNIGVVYSPLAVEVQQNIDVICQDPHNVHSLNRPKYRVHQPGV